MTIRLPGRFTATILMAGIVAMGLAITSESVVCWHAVEPAGLAPKMRNAQGWVRGLIWSTDGNTLYSESRGERFLEFKLIAHDMTRADGRGSIWVEPLGITAMEASLSPDAHKVLLTTERGDLSWIDLRSFESTEFAPPPSSIFRSPTVSHNSRLLAAATDRGQIYLWQASQATHVICQSSESEQVTKLQFSDDDQQLLACRLNGKIEIWDTNTGTLRHGLSGSPVTTVATFLHDGTKLISSLAGSCIQITNLETGEVSWREPHGLRERNHVWCLELSQDDSVVAWSGIDNQVVICDLKRPGKRVEFENPTNVTNIRFSPDSRSLAVAGTEAVIRIYDTSTGREVRQIDTSLTSSNR